MGLMGAYQTFVFCQEDSDTSVDLADCEGDEHCLCYVDWIGLAT
jgi:hypothetical protein